MSVKTRLKVSISKNPTKEGVKIQFSLPQGADSTVRDELTQQLQSKLNKSLNKLGLNVSVDTDVQFDNVIGFLILLNDIKLMIKKALTEGKDTTNDNA